MGTVPNGQNVGRRKGTETGVGKKKKGILQHAWVQKTGRHPHDRIHREQSDHRIVPHNQK